MAKKVNITEKLSFEEKPVLVIKAKEIKVNNEAVIILKITPLFENFSGDNITKVYELLFDESEREKIDSLHLNFTDFARLLGEAAALVAGDEVGETVTPAMT